MTLSRVNITSKSLYSISKLKNLEYLYLADIYIDDSGMIKILNSCHKLRSLIINLEFCLVGSKITNEILYKSIEVAQKRINAKKQNRINS